MLDELRKLDRDNERILFTLFALFGKPRTLLDIGSGTGIMVQTARKLGVNAIGIDLLATPPDIKHDLTKPIGLGKHFDMVLCLEVAEHLPERAAPLLCQTIAAHTPPNGRLIFSAAMPGQTGIEHVNLQKPAYWRKLLYDAGKFSYRDDLTAKLQLLLQHTSGAASMWLVPNISCF